MIIAANISHIIGGLAEVLAVVVCIDLFGAYKQKGINTPRAVVSLIVHIVISAATLFLNNTFDSSAGFPMALLYAAKNFITLFIIYGRLNLKIIYPAIFIDLTLSFASSCISCVLANLLETDSRNTSPYVTLFVQVSVLFALIALRKKADSKKVMLIPQIIPKRILPCYY